MIYFPWKTEDEQDAAYFFVFVCGYPFEDARRAVKQATRKFKSRVASMGRHHRTACTKGLANLLDSMDVATAMQKRLLPVVINPHTKGTTWIPQT